MKRLLASACLAAFLVAPSARGSEKTLAVFDACWKTVKAHFYDKKFKGIDWPEIGASYRSLADEAKTDGQLCEVLDEMLARLHASHSSILSATVYRSVVDELTGKKYLSCGVLLEESMPHRYFVRALYEGGSGVQAGLEIGDRIVSVDGKDADSSPSVIDAGYDAGAIGPGLFFLSSPKAAPLHLVVQRTPDADSRKETTLHPARTNGVEAAKNSVRVIEKGGKRIGYVHIWFCQKGAGGVLENAVQGPLRDCDALVVDLRGRGGWVGVTVRLANVFRPQKVYLFGEPIASLPPLWCKPAVFLTDERTRSAKELLAYWIRRDHLGPLVGMRTEGAVLGANFFRLPGDHYMELPVQNIVIDGVRLEGKGVAPDYPVDFVVPYAQGRDPILEKGVAVALKRLAIPPKQAN